MAGQRLTRMDPNHRPARHANMLDLRIAGSIVLLRCLLCMRSLPEAAPASAGACSSSFLPSAILRIPPQMLKQLHEAPQRVRRAHLAWCRFWRLRPQPQMPQITAPFPRRLDQPSTRRLATTLSSRKTSQRPLSASLAQVRL